MAVLQQNNLNLDIFNTLYYFLLMADYKSLGTHNFKDKGPMIVAELSANHGGTLQSALLNVELAAKAGAHCFKLQTYKPETLTVDCNLPEYVVNDKNGLWAGETLYSLYTKAMTPWEWHKPIFEKCRELNIIPFSSPFDDTAVDLLEGLDVQFYKIASFESCDFTLLKKVAETKKPVIISTGTSYLHEISESINFLRKNGVEKIFILKCVSSYPALHQSFNLNTLPHLKKILNCDIGISDHTQGLASPLAGIALGAKIIEKHIDFNEEKSLDSAFSIGELALKTLCIEAKNAYLALGRHEFTPSKDDIENRKFRSSLIVTEDIKKGDLFTSKNLKARRPGNGLPIKHVWDIWNKKTAIIDIPKGTPLKFEFLG